ncbi:peptidase, partial [Streptomyces cinereoruber]
MHSPVPRPPSFPPSAVPRAELTPYLTPSLAAAVSGARRRALRDGDRQIDTAHLLHSLVESDPEAAAAFEDRDQLARVLGYLVQRSIGYGLRWQRSVEDSTARRLLPATRGTDLRNARTPGWSPAATAA